MERNFDRTDALITLAAVAVGFAIVAYATWQNRQRFADWANQYREQAGQMIDDATRQELRAEEGIE